jgi:hypothetical protein
MKLKYYETSHERNSLTKVHDYPGEFHMATEDKIIYI